MVTASSANVSWWPVLLPNLISSVVLAGAMILLYRKRRWRDCGLMGKAIALPAEHMEPEPRQVRDMIVGEEAYVDPSAVVASKKMIATDDATGGLLVVVTFDSGVRRFEQVGRCQGRRFPPPSRSGIAPDR